jgi:hypothetical protein
LPPAAAIPSAVSAGQQHDPRPPGVRFQTSRARTVSRADRNLRDLPHRRRLAHSRRLLNPLLATEHYQFAELPSGSFHFLFGRLGVLFGGFG